MWIGLSLTAVLLFVRQCYRSVPLPVAGVSASVAHRLLDFLCFLSPSSCEGSTKMETEEPVTDSAQSLLFTLLSSNTHHFFLEE